MEVNGDLCALGHFKKFRKCTARHFDDLQNARGNLSLSNPLRITTRQKDLNIFG